MRRRALLAGILSAVPLVAGAQTPTAQDRADLARVETYLNGLRALKARFTQVAPDGAISQGLAWIQRPGRMRFQYDAPSPLLLVAGRGLVVYYDRELEQTTNIPIGETPLGILLRDDLSLSGGDVKVVRVERLPGQLQVTVLRSATPADGTLTLIFSDPPLVLRQWIVLDAQRQVTRVSLNNIETGGSFDQDMFSFINPKFLKGQDRRYQ